MSERDLVKPLLTQALEAALGITPAHADADADTRFRACVAELERAAAALNARGTLLSARAGGAGGAAAAGGAPHAPPRLPAPRPPVLVIDEADRLLLDEGFVGVLQELAKARGGGGGCMHETRESTLLAFLCNTRSRGDRCGVLVKVSC